VGAVREAVRARRPGEALSLTIARAGKSQEITVTVGDD
jgi:S1-C subfamily serine protease